jgi:hypothetical protein
MYRSVHARGVPEMGGGIRGWSGEELGQVVSFSVFPRYSMHPSMDTNVLTYEVTYADTDLLSFSAQITLSKHVEESTLDLRLF